MYKINLLIIFLLIGITNSCNSQKLDYSLDTKFGIVKYSVTDTGTVRDFLTTAENVIPSISNELGIDFDNSVVIEIYPDQESYNNSILEPDLKNSPAISGNFRIQLISPLAPLYAENKIGTIKYADRLSFFVHEYTHILLDKFEEPIPLCIDEGVASFYSSKEFYLDMALKYVRQINYIPSIEQLVSHYHEVPAPDLFSFLLIDFSIQKNGKENLPNLIRDPESIKQLNESWIEYIRGKYY